MKKIVITLVGKDTVGIIAKVCTYFAENNINILDIAQTVVRDLINMVMVIDIEPSEKTFEDVEKEIEEVSKNVRCIIHAQRESDLDELAEAEA